MEIKKVYINEEKYPASLREIKDPPDPLYYAGDLSLTNQVCCAIVGSRRTTEYGRWAAKTLAEKVAEAGGVVVSGMAAGIDTCAHWGARMEERFPTIAVLGCGVDVCFPRNNKQLHKAIAEEGLIVSEYPPGAQPTKYTFPQRNRIISGLSQATVVVQAPNTSGALITAERAMEQGRLVYSVPGNINSPYYLGSNKLLRDGAMTLAVMDDLIYDLGLDWAGRQLIMDNFGKDEVDVLQQLVNHGEMTVDQLVYATKKEISKINGIITILEMKGVVCLSLGKIFIAK